MWNMKYFIIPVIIGVTGMLTKGLKISGNNIRKAVSIFRTRKTTVPGTSHITRKVTQSENWSLSGGVHR